LRGDESERSRIPQRTLIAVRRLILPANDPACEAGCFTEQGVSLNLRAGAPRCMYAGTVGNASQPRAQFLTTAAG
jgi:hypothetical protein